MNVPSRAGSARRIGVVVIGLLAAGVAMCAPATAAPGKVATVGTARWDAAALGAPVLQNCFNAAKASRADAWTCSSDGLLVLDQKSKKTTMRAVAPTVVGGGVTAAAEPDPDTWCEGSNAVCSDRVSAYVAWAKGNLAYGDSTGAIGNWDNAYRVNLNGRSPRYNIAESWDNGPAVTLSLSLTCNETPFPYSQCGNSSRSATISSSNWYYKPSTINGVPLTDATSYRATLGGTFTAAGHYQTFGIPALRSIPWNCPAGGGNCTFP
jgi:hypothetical protein